MLGEWNELLRGDRPFDGMLPAHERLDMRDAFVVETHLGLVVHRQLVVLGGSAQIVDQREPAQMQGIAPAAVERNGDLGLLGIVHGDVGPTEQVFGGVGVARIERDAETDFGI